MWREERNQASQISSTTGGEAGEAAVVFAKKCLMQDWQQCYFAGFLQVGDHLEGMPGDSSLNCDAWTQIGY